MSFWDTVRYGWAPNYVLTIAGIPVCWTELASGKTLPSGYTVEDASLVIDDSGDIGIDHIDRERGVAVAMPLKFKLLDTDTTRDWMRKWSKFMTLTDTLEPSDLAATVDDSSGWANGDAAWLGLERIEIGTVASGTNLTGLTRATAGSLAYQHRAGTSAQLVTDRPRYWRGRDVILWAAPMDPSGYMPGANLLTEAVQVWRGRIESGPVREIDGFAFEAAELGRVLDQGLIGKVSGKVVDTSHKYKIASGWRAYIYLVARDNTGAVQWEYELKLSPFATLADGDMLTAGEIRTCISDAWSAAIAAAGATVAPDLGDLTWVLDKGYYKARVKAIFNPSVYWIFRKASLEGKDAWFDEADLHFVGGMSGDAWVPIGWKSAGNPLTPYAGADAPSNSLTIQLDEGSPADVPQFGRVRVTVGDLVNVYSFNGSGYSGNDVYLAGLTPLAGASLAPLTGPDAIGAGVELLLTCTGTPTGLMLATLESSGSTALRGSYDILQRGQGYSLDDDVLHLASFQQAAAPLSSLQCEVNHAGAAFADLFGGALGLFRAAVVCRPDVSQSSRRQLLTLVSTAPFGSGWSTTIRDTDLLSHTDDPILAIDRAEAPNVVSVLRPLGTSDDAADRLTLADQPSAEAEGRREVEYHVPATSRDALWDIAKAAAASQLAADQTLQVLAVRVPPWVQAEAGDVVYLDTTHPGIWTWAGTAGAPGYTGPARVTGRAMNPKTLAVKLVLLIDGGVTVHALSPAMRISAYQHATTPTWIEVPLKYLPHMEAALADAGGPIWLYHYKAGKTETVAQRHQVSAAAETGGVCRLTISSNPTGHTLSTTERSTLTLPTLDGGHISTWQEPFAHIDDGSQWG